MRWALRSRILASLGAEARRRGHDVRVYVQTLHEFEQRVLPIVEKASEGAPQEVVDNAIACAWTGFVVGVFDSEEVLGRVMESA